MSQEQAEAPATTTGTPMPPPQRLAQSGITPYRIAVPQFLKMIEAGVFPPDSRIELLGGILVEKMTRHPPHNFAVLKLGQVFRAMLPADWLVSEEKPLVLGRTWRPEPDLTIIRGPVEQYRRRDPTVADIALVVEVAESSYAGDRGPKWVGYAKAGVPVYWIVNLPERRIEVYSGPTGRGKSARYANRADYNDQTEVPVVVDGRERGRVAVRELLA